MAKDRPPSFQFYPRDFMADTGHLTDRQRSRYLLGLCRSWMEGGFGVGDPEEWRDWLGYESDEEWAEDGPVLRGLFFIPPCEPEFWVQKRMASERGEQAARYRSASLGARMANAARTHSARIAHGGRTHSVTPASAFASATALESKPNTLGQAPPDRVTAKDRLADWMEPFDEFWRDYPRKVAKEAARRAYAKIEPKNQETCDLIFRGLDHYRANIWPSRPPDKIEHAATWLNQRRFTDAAEA